MAKKGIPKKNGSGQGRHNNQGRGGCAIIKKTRQDKSDTSNKRKNNDNNTNVIEYNKKIIKKYFEVKHDV